ncbi:hypothetical protein TNCT_604161 [Trichonephila clavata]|uniref:Uncharacterized protein n=1 Tax=Trichonephila clavata TaxID=2740835 RepID=A0A8X6LUS2_TRICU|nr:hypothetical protein TNCT_604161 [Trichonephila clavata]
MKGTYLIGENLVRLSELTRQVTPRTNCGHAPPSTESRKSCQSVHRAHVRTGFPGQAARRVTFVRSRIAGGYRLRSELQRYLIFFEPLTFVLGQWKHSWQMPSQWVVFRRSKNFTSSVGIRMPRLLLSIIPSVSVDLFPRKPGTEGVFHRSVHYYPGGRACSEHSNFCKAITAFHPGTTF